MSLNPSDKPNGSFTETNPEKYFSTKEKKNKLVAIMTTLRFIMLPTLDKSNEGNEPKGLGLGFAANVVNWPSSALKYCLRLEKA